MTQDDHGAFPWGRVLLAAVLLVSGVFLLLDDIPPVALSWETASEVGAAGFNVYRAEVSGTGVPVSDISGDDFVQINAALIPAEGDELVGAAYRFEDDDVAPGRRYAYRIEEVEWDGQATLYPETVTVRAGLPRAWTKAEGGLLLLLGAFLLWRSFKR
ncbi:MAG: hypothetical protein ACK2UQ_18790 [Anaerolineae bacterium]